MNKEKGRRYRQIVLERSDSMAPMDILREFLGREPSDEAYFDANGLLGASKWKPAKRENSPD